MPIQILSASKNCELITANTPLSLIFRRTVDIWTGLCGDNELPDWKIDHLMGFPPRLIPYANIIRWDDTVSEYRFVYWGSGRSEMTGHDYSFELLPALEPRQYSDLVRSELDEVREVRRPMLSNARVRLADGMTTEVSKVRLPFRDSAGNVDIVLTFDDVEQFVDRHYLTWVSPNGRDGVALQAAV